MRGSSGRGEKNRKISFSSRLRNSNEFRRQSDHKHFTSPLPFNVIPHIDKFQDNGYTKEEMKVTWETRKICEMADDFPVSCTAVRIPTFRAHSETIVLETTEKVDVKAAQELLAKSPGVKVRRKREEESGALDVCDCQF